MSNPSYRNLETVRFKIPINSRSRLAIDQEVERLRHSVIPIIGEFRGRPYLAGSAVALNFGGTGFLVTAHHVLEDSIGPLGYFASSGFSRPFGGTFQISAADDLAVKILGKPDLADLCHIPFLTEGDLANESHFQNKFYASVTGYPSTASRRRDKVTLETPMESAAGFASAEADGKVSVQFDKKEGVYSAKGHVRPRDPYGKSGGAIFGMLVSGLEIIPDQSAKLVGIPLEWRNDEKRIVGAGIPVLKQLLKAAISGAAEI